jgi:hypothetical protein
VISCPSATPLQHGLSGKTAWVTGVRGTLLVKLMQLSATYLPVKAPLLTLFGKVIVRPDGSLNEYDLVPENQPQRNHMTLNRLIQNVTINMIHAESYSVTTSSSSSVHPSPATTTESLLESRLFTIAFLYKSSLSLRVSVWTNSRMSLLYQRYTPIFGSPTVLEANLPFTSHHEARYRRCHFRRRWRCCCCCRSHTLRDRADAS